MRRKELWQPVENATQGAKQYKYLYRLMLLEENIRKAYKRLRKGKTKRKEIQKIDADLDAEVRAMQEMIRNTRPGEVEHPELAYKPRRRFPKFIREHGKTRKIYMPEIHEQWLHHIISLNPGADHTGNGLPVFMRQLPEKGSALRKAADGAVDKERKGDKELCEDRHPAFL